jgi:hypothetical protein
VIARNQTRRNNSRGGGLYMCNGTIRTTPFMGTTSTNNGSLGGGMSDCEAESYNNILWANEADASDATAQNLHCSTRLTVHSELDRRRNGQPVRQNPQLINPADDDFHLGSASPCIDAGKRALGLIVDFECEMRGFNSLYVGRGDGSHFDIGADESSFALTRPIRFGCGNRP